MKSLPKGDFNLDNIIDKINELAVLRNVKITALNPLSERVFDFYRSLGIALNVSALNYTDMGNFINDIEKSDYILRVDSWSTSGVSPEQITVQMEVASIRVKE